MQKLKIFITLAFFSIILCQEEKMSQFCNQYNCPNTRGKCMPDNSCACVKGFITESDEIEVKCNYKQKTKAKAFLLEFIIGFGLGHIYMGNLKIALIKLCFSFVSCYFICFLPSCQKADCCIKFSKVLHIILGISWAIWQIIDGAMILLGKYKDNNGISLLDW